MLELIKVLGFLPKENTTNIFEKRYTLHDNYSITYDSQNKVIDFGSKIFFNDTKNSIQNFKKPEDLVVLECVNRLLEKGYAPQIVTLEKTFPSGHGHSGRLDILVSAEDNSAYMMIECKTWAKEFDKEYNNLQRNGGQLFTYFQNDKNAEILVLYTSKLDKKNVVYKNEIIKIEEEYRTTSNVKDFYDRWNKLTKNNGVFNTWVTAYNYESKALTPKELKDITAEDSSKIFNRFMEILRHNVVSDKPNAFSKIFTLFLCKIMDEKKTKPNEELWFQWLEGEDTHVSFQKRLTDLYQQGMKEFLDKEVTDLSDKEFEEKFGDLDGSLKQQLLDEFTKIRLQKNNEFAIKDVFDQDTFEENAIVVKEVVELLQNYKIRYSKKQQFLSDFFELLLTTGLKQEVGQFFTPVPIAKFIIRSIPFDSIIKDKLEKGIKDELLPNVIDYAVGSGHFITEAMDEIQKNINNISHDEYISDTARKLKSWKEDHFDWAYDYVYGIEKDYRLVKTAKVGCYLHGDGLAKVIHGDGLSNFTKTKEYKGKLTKKDKNYSQDNKQFDMVLSNPPYSVSAFKNIGKTYNEDDFELYSNLTDQSSEIEALFIERTKQLLKDGGIAGIILPSSILSNTGIYTKTREIIFKYFDIIAITELGSNTFMATGTNTVVLFLRRKNNMEHKKLEDSVKKLFDDKKDITINGIENPLQKYLSHVWNDMAISDYFTLLDDVPNDKLSEHEIMKEYANKIKGDIAKQLEQIVTIEKEKLLYFIMGYSQKVTVVKTGEKKAEKKFLGYEFSNRRGSEGIHPTQRGSTIDDCTSLYDESSYTNVLKANSYIYSAFSGEFKEIDESLKNNVSYVDLVDMMTFDRVSFEKNISLSVKKKVKLSSKWNIQSLKEFVDLQNGFAFKSSDYVEKSSILNFRQANIRLKGILDLRYKKTYLPESFKIKYKDYLLHNNDIVIAMTDMNSELNLLAIPTIFKNTTNQSFLLNQRVGRFINFKSDIIIPAYLSYILKSKISREQLKSLGFGSVQFNLSKKDLLDFKIPLPPKDIQERIIKEIEKLEEFEAKSNLEIEEYKSEILGFVLNIDKNTKVSLDTVAKIVSGQSPKSEFYNEIGEGLAFYQGKLEFTDRYIEAPQVWTTRVTKESIKRDILMSVRAPVGDVNINPFNKICIGRGLCAIRTKGEVLQEFLFAYLKSIKEEIVTGGNKGATFNAITKPQVSNIKIPLVSIEEQKKIVSKIETIEKKINKIEKELASIPQQKEAILKKYL